MKQIIGTKSFVAMFSNAESMFFPMVETILVLSEERPDKTPDGRLVDSEHVERVSFWATPDAMDAIAEELSRVATEARAMMAKIELKLETP